MSKLERKTRCWACSSLDVQRWGKRNGHQRFKCNNCGIYFTSENKGTTKSNELGIPNFTRTKGWEIL